MPALADLVEGGTIRLIDAAFVGKDENGEVFTLELTELAPDMQEALDELNIEVQGLFNDEELLATGQELEPNSSAALLVWENVWARKVAQAIRDAGGVWSRSSVSRTTSYRQRASGRWKRPRPNKDRRSRDERTQRSRTDRDSGRGGRSGPHGCEERPEESGRRTAGGRPERADRRTPGPAGPAARSRQPRPRRPSPTPPREIQKYAALKEQGLITEEEFEAKKKQILGI